MRRKQEPSFKAKAGGAARQHGSVAAATQRRDVITSGDHEREAFWANENILLFFQWPGRIGAVSEHIADDKKVSLKHVSVV